MKPLKDASFFPFSSFSQWKMWQNMALKFLLAHTFTEALIATFDQKFRQGLSFMIKIMKIVKTENFLLLPRHKTFNVKNYTRRNIAVSTHFRKQ